VIIDGRFNGPGGSANGGYTAGRLAAYLPGGNGVEVTLHRPPPLDTELSIHTDQITSPASAAVAIVRAYDGSELIAEATPNAVGDDEVVPGVAFEVAVDAAKSYAGFRSHPFPTCFVCGPARPSADGLGLYPGRLPDGRTATPFTPPRDISAVLVWASLDCPGGWAVPPQERRYVLGRIAARVDGVPNPGEECVVMGQLTGEQGRRAYVRTTLYSASGHMLAVARATWFAL
jgi:hypothetical protein